MERCPSLVVAAVDVGAVLHQELHHVQVVVDARLKEREMCLKTVGLKKIIFSRGEMDLVQVCYQPKMETSHHLTWNKNNY